MSVTISSALIEEGTFRFVSIYLSDLSALIHQELATTFHYTGPFDLEIYYNEDDEETYLLAWTPLDLDDPRVHVLFPDCLDSDDVLAQLLTTLIGPGFSFVKPITGDTDTRLLFSVPTSSHEGANL